MPVDEGRVVEALRHSFAQIMRFRALTHMFDGWQVSLMLDDGQSKALRDHPMEDQYERAGSARRYRLQR